jgi:hypothetical protein
LKFQFGVSQLKRLSMNSDWCFFTLDNRLNQACVFWACRWIVMDR